MANSMLFLAQYPNIKNEKDGMVSRIKAMDSFFVDQNRTYLHISLSQFKKGTYYQVGNVEVFELNIIWHFFRIIKILFRFDIIYSHSIYLSLFIWPFLFFHKWNFILDAHGLVPEEEIFFNRGKIRFYYYSFVEKIIFKYVDCVICVTNEMKKHFIRKYKLDENKFIIYSILPNNLKTNSSINLKRQEGAFKINIIYSGGISPWQNIDLMLQTIKLNMSDEIRYTILTSDVQLIINKISNLGIDNNAIEVKSVLPNELFHYYENADYAFILRDDHIVNRVANPTKMIEYLFYGIIPIVLSSKIGDYAELGYEYLHVSNFNEDICKPLNKSVKNISIANQLAEANKLVNFRNIVFKNSESDI